MGKSKRAKVQAATARLARTDGLGVLVPGGVVLTAAYCIESFNSGGMALGDCIEQVDVPTGGKVGVAVFAVEPVADIAVLGAADRQAVDESMAEVLEELGLGSVFGFDEWCDTTEAIPLGPAPRAGSRIGVRVLTHMWEWFTGTGNPKLFAGLRPLDGAFR